MVQGTIQVMELIKLVSMLVSIIIGFMVISRQIKKNHREYVDSKLNVVNTQIIEIKEDIKENKRDNEREHEQIRDDFVQRVDMIFEWIKNKAG